MNTVDLVVLALLALNALLGFGRGFARQSLKIAGGIFAVWAALNFYEKAGAFLRDSFSLAAWGSTSIAVLGFLAVGLGVYLAANLLAHVAKAGIEKARLGGADRFLGLIFGAVKGAFLCALALHLFDPVAKHLPEVVSEQFYGAADGDPEPSRAYTFYREHIKSDADRLQSQAVGAAQKPGGK